VILTRDRQKSGYKLKRLLVAKADSIEISGNIIKYRDLDGNTQLKHFSITDENESNAEDVLPPHETIKNWDQVEFSDDKFLFARHVENYGRDIQYWTLKEGKWHLLCEGKNFQQELRYINGNVYKSSYNDSGLTIELLNSETLVFEPTNVANMPTSVVSGKFIPAKKDPKTIIAVKKYNSGIEDWTPPREDSCRSTQLENIINKLQCKWRDEFKPYADVSLSIEDLIFDSDDQLYGIRYAPYQDTTFSGRACLLGDDLSVEWQESFDEASFSMHPALQLQSVDISGHDVPYYFVAPEGMPNGKTIVLMDGGPHSYYTGNFAEMIKSYSKEGYAVILPQESLRTGYGWKHFEKGLGEMGRGNLHQLLRVFYDAAEKGFIPDLQQVSLYGHSYGGFVATSFALRWDELHKEARIQKRFNFTSIVADAAWVEHELSNAVFSRLVLPDDALINPEPYINRVMPTHRTAEHLLTPLFMIHGISDTRCSADHTRMFSTKLSNAGTVVPLFWHKGDHNPPKHKSYPKFVKALMESADTTELEKLIGLERERSSQDQAVCTIS
jgi:pimeloyl-ACP methyl ester carboxylesterase